MNITMHSTQSAEQQLRAMLRSAMCLLVDARRRLNIADIPSTFGSATDDIDDFLIAADILMPGTLAEIENPAEPVNKEASSRPNGPGSSTPA